MKHQPNTGTPTNDIVYTPPSLAGAIGRPPAQEIFPEGTAQ